ncbi:MAG TPA: ribbon-helix-helix protein, CopG family [Vicinamibacteria bacterium]|nr:ribbon-helix-helix protein, CopG family [Vicinamibacteria bacterium]
MRESLTVSLPAKTKRLIERAARESGLTTSEYVRLAIFRKLWQDAVAESRRVAVPRARAKGIFTDEEVFRLIS